MKKALSLLLACLMLAASLIACAEKGGTEDSSTQAPEISSTPAAEETTVEEETVAENVRDTLPESANYNDQYVILSRKATSYEVMTNETSGDIVKDAVSERNGKIQDRFGATVEVVELAGDWGDRNDFISHVKNSVNSGKSDYDLIMTHSAYIVNFGIDGIAYNMKNLEQIDFSKKWWCESYAENVTINNCIYSAIGDIGYTMYQYMICMFVNKGLAAEYKVDDVYTLVNDGKWTFEKMMEYAKLVYVDSNNNGAIDSGDTFGYGLGSHICRAAPTVFDAQITVKNADGKQEINIPNEKYIDVYNLMYSTVYDNTQNVTYKDEGANLASEFAAEHIMFYSERLGLASQFKDMTSEYGVVPFPKYNEDQENYISSSRDYMSAIAIPSNIDNPEMVGTVTEALCMYGYTVVTPQYYELTLKYKYMSDAQAVQMLDLVRDSLTHDFAMTYTNSLDLIYSIAGDNVKNGVKDISKTLKASAKLYKNDLEKLYAAYETK